uniref:Uncharacterized protein n=1 Tax=Arundo donax TaxID=35708 RepID=A0A0A8YUI5_ARUDO
MSIIVLGLSLFPLLSSPLSPCAASFPEQKQEAPRSLQHLLCVASSVEWSSAVLTCLSPSLINLLYMLCRLSQPFRSLEASPMVLWRTSSGTKELSGSNSGTEVIR